MDFSKIDGPNLFKVIDFDRFLNSYNGADIWKIKNDIFF